MPSFGEFQTVLVLGQSAFGSLYSATRSGGEPRFAVKVFRPNRDLLLADDLSATEAEAEVSRQISRFLYTAHLQQSVAADGSIHWAKIHLVGSANDSGFYVTDLYTRSAQKLVAGRFRWDAASLRAVITSIVKGLQELRRASGRAHGNLKLSNVLIGDGSINRASVVLTDPVESASEADDLRAIGEILYQLVLARPFRVNSGWPIAGSSEWDILRTGADRWRELCSKLLDPLKAGGGLTVDDLATELTQLRPSSISNQLRFGGAAIAIGVCVGVAVSYSRYSSAWERLRSSDAKWLAEISPDDVRGAQSPNPMAPLATYLATHNSAALQSLAGSSPSNPRPPLNWNAYRQIQDTSTMVRLEHDLRQHWDKLATLTQWSANWRTRNWPGADTFAADVNTVASATNFASNDNPYIAMIRLATIYPYLQATEARWANLLLREKRYEMAVVARNNLIQGSRPLAADAPQTAPLPGALSMIESKALSELRLGPQDSLYDHVAELAAALNRYDDDPIWPVIDEFMASDWINVSSDSLAARSTSPQDWLKGVIPNWLSFKQVRDASEAFGDFQWTSRTDYLKSLCDITLNAPNTVTFQQVKAAAVALDKLRDAEQSFQNVAAGFAVDPILAAYPKTEWNKLGARVVRSAADLDAATGDLRRDANLPEVLDVSHFLPAWTADDRNTFLNSDWHSSASAIADADGLRDWLGHAASCTAACKSVSSLLLKYPPRHWESLAHSINAELGSRHGIDLVTASKDILSPLNQLENQYTTLQNHLNHIHAYVANDPALSSIMSYSDAVVPSTTGTARDRITQFASALQGLNDAIESENLEDFLARHATYTVNSAVAGTGHGIRTPANLDGFVAELQLWKSGISSGLHNNEVSSLSSRLSDIEASYNKLPAGTGATIKPNIELAHVEIARIASSPTDLPGTSRSSGEVNALLSRIEASIGNAQLESKRKAEQEQQDLDRAYTSLLDQYKFDSKQTEDAWTSWVHDRQRSGQDSDPVALQRQGQVRALNLAKLHSAVNDHIDLHLQSVDPAVNRAFDSIAAEHNAQMLEASIHDALYLANSASEFDTHVATSQKQDDIWFAALKAFGDEYRSVSDALGAAYGLQDEPLRTAIGRCESNAFWPLLKTRISSFAGSDSSSVPVRIERLRDLQSRSLTSADLTNAASDRDQNIEYVMAVWRKVHPVAADAPAINGDVLDQLDRTLSPLLNGIPDVSRRTHLQTECIGELGREANWSGDDAGLSSLSAWFDGKIAEFGIDLLDPAIDPRVRFNVALLRLNHAAQIGAAPENVEAFRRATASLATSQDEKKLFALRSDETPTRDSPAPSAGASLLKGWTSLPFDPATPALKVFTRSFLGNHPRKPATYTLSFIKVGSGAYVCTCDFPVGLFVEMVHDMPDLQPSIRDRMPPAPQVASWQWEKSPVVSPLWTRAIPGLDKVYPDDDPAPPTTLAPLQAVPADVARFISATLGCRLPTVQEWKSAVDLEQQDEQANGSAGIVLNLRDQSVKREWDYLTSGTQNGDPRWRTALGLEETFEPHPYGDAVWRTVDSQPYQDDALWFQTVDASSGGRRFKHLLGNLRQFLWNPGNGNADPPPTRLDLFTANTGGTLSVAGYSALSFPVPGLPVGPGPRLPALTVDVPSSALHPPQAYSDVGFRLAFSSANSYATQVREELKSIHYLAITRADLRRQ